MERRPFTIKELPVLKRFARGASFALGWLITLFVIGRETGGLTTILLMFVSFILFFAWYNLTDPRLKTSALLLSPCPQCGKSPMKYERSLEGDCVFICDQCQIEWTLNQSPETHK
jgi:hypothetical protein